MQEEKIGMCKQLLIEIELNDNFKKDNLQQFASLHS